MKHPRKRADGDFKGEKGTVRLKKLIENQKIKFAQAESVPNLGSQLQVAPKHLQLDV